MNPLLMIGTVSAFILALLLYIYYFIKQSDRAERFGFEMLLVGFVVQTVTIVASYSQLGRFPVIDLKESLCFFSWSLAAIYILVRLNGPARALGVFICLLATGFLIAACAIKSSGYSPDARFDTALFPVHILFAFLGYAAFTLAFGSSIMYLLQERGLKVHHPGAFLKRLPSLQELDTINYHGLTLGFFMLTLGIMTGAIWLHNVEGRFLKWDPKVIASMVTWLLYAVILHTRLIVGWRGRRTAMLSILGFACVLITFLGVGLIQAGFHNFFK